MDQEDYEQAIYRFNKAREIDQGMVWDSNYDVMMLRRKKERKWRQDAYDNDNDYDDDNIVNIN